MESNNTESKICRGCNVEQSITQFYVHKMMKDNRLNYCKSCVKKRVKKRYYEKHDEIVEYERKRSLLPERKRKASVYQQTRRKRYPQKDKARQLLNDAVRDGKITKQPCYLCGSTNKIEAHHHDYSKPLDVKWVCFYCHRSVEHGQIVSC